MTPRICILLALIWPLGALQADEQVRRVQEELRKRNLYFGEVDGRETEETKSALKRYQQRKGLAVGGHLTAETLRALNLPAEGAPPQEEWPEGAVLKSDAARSIPETERQVLESAATGELAPVAEAPEEIPPQEETPPAVPAVPQMGEPEIRSVIEQYLVACEQHTPGEEMRFYADRVNYFDHGWVDRTFVAQDVKHFYDRWPERKYELLDCQIAPGEGPERTVTFRIAFHYEGPHRKVSGKTSNNFRLRVGEAGPRFVSMKEQRVH